MAKTIVKRVDENVGNLPLAYEDSQELMQDLATVKIAEFEEGLETEIGTIDTELKVLKEELDKSYKSTNKLVADFDYSDFSEKVNSFVKAARGLFNGVKATFSTPVLSDNKIIVAANIQFERGDGYYQTQLSKSNSFETTADIRKGLAKQKDIAAQMGTLNERRAKLKIDLSKVDKVERRVKAVVAKQRLGKTETGRKLMDEVKSIKSLPGLQ